MLEQKQKNYEPVSFLNIFSKIHETFIHNNLTNYVDLFLSEFNLAYQRWYSLNHALLRLVEGWKKTSEVVGNRGLYCSPISAWEIKY